MKRVPKPVIILGLVSLFNDMAAEMIYPIMPIFLTAVIGAPVFIVGFIEGMAEATASLMKFFSGYLSDRVGRRKIFVVGGYSMASVSKLLTGLASSWGLVLFARLIDRFGKGLRTSPRDALLLTYSRSDNRGLIFGVQRSLDSLGAVLGPIIALILLSIFPDNLRLIFFLAFIPSVIAVILLYFFVHEKKDRGKPMGELKKIDFSIRRMSPGFKLFLIISIIFALGNSSDAFLLLRAKDLGLMTQFVILTYILYNLSQSIFAVPIGKMADKIGARLVFSWGLLVFAFVYFMFGFIKESFWVWILFPVYGIYIAATDGVSKAYISQFFKEEEAGSYFGLFQTSISVATFLASFIGGILWNTFFPGATFYFGSLMALIAFLILGWGKLVRKI